MNTIRRRLGSGWLVLLSSIAISSIGCQPKSNVVPVHGKVLLNGKPLTKGMVATLPAAGRGSNGTIQADGTFELRTFGKNDGALIGKHKAAVVAYDAPANAGPEASSGKLLVPQRYTNPETSGLTFEVKADGDNSPEFKLTSP